MADDGVPDKADNSAQSDKDKIRKRKRVDEQRTSISVSVPENSLLVVQGNTNVAGNIIYQSGYNRVKLESLIRKKHRHASKSKEKRLLTEDEISQRESEMAQARVAATEEKWRRRENELGYKLTDPEHIELDRKEKELLVSKVEEVKKELAEAYRLEKQKKRDKRDEEHGHKLSEEEHIEFEKKEREEESKRRKTKKTKGGISAKDFSMAPLTAIFKPTPRVQEVSTPAESESLSTAPILSNMQALSLPETVAIEASDSSLSTKIGPFNKGNQVYLRVAFMDMEKVDNMKLGEASVYIRESGIIGKVKIKDMVSKEVALLDLKEFANLSSYAMREAGHNVSRSEFRRLLAALNNAAGQVNVKYLTKQNRKQGRNHSWTDNQVSIIKDAVERAKKCSPTVCFKKAAEFLNAKYKGPLGTITKKQVWNVYYNKVQLKHVPRGPVGRPALLSHQCLESIDEFAKKTLGRTFKLPMSYFMYHMRRIIRKHGEANLLRGSKDSYSYLRTRILNLGGAPRKAANKGGKQLYVGKRKVYTDTFLLRLAYLVQLYGLSKEDVYNFDETSIRYHEDADNKVMAFRGEKQVQRDERKGNKDAKASLTFIPMVSCAGSKLEPAMIFKGTKGVTRSIPDYKSSFKRWNDMYGEGKICFMQNMGKWTTNETMKQWFIHHIIPRIKSDKQKRRDEGQTVCDKYVVILDGVSTHCFSSKDGMESWIKTLQRVDEDMILLWLPPNMTGDLQPLDVNFNWPFKAKFKDHLFLLKLLTEEDDDGPVEAPEMQDRMEMNKIISDKGHEFHTEWQSDDEDGNDTHAHANNETAVQVKSRVIEAIIETYKSISNENILTSWRISGRNVMRDFYGENDSRVIDYVGYNSAWEEDTQKAACNAHEKGMLFFKGMSGGVSDVEGKLQFLPLPGRKKKKAATDTDKVVSEDDLDMEDRQTTECSQEISEYSEGDDDESADIDDSDDELVECFEGCTLQGDGEAQST